MNKGLDAQLNKCAIRQFRPQSQQESFFQALNDPAVKLIVLAGGNGTGKSVALAYALSKFVLEKQRRRVALVCSSFKEIRNNWWLYLLDPNGHPKFEVKDALTGIPKPAGPLIPSFMVEGKNGILYTPGGKSSNQWREAHLYGGRIITTYSMEQPMDAFNDWYADLIVVDEWWPDDKAGLYERLLARAEKGGGKIIIAGTPEAGSAEDGLALLDRVKAGTEPHSKYFEWWYENVEHKTEEEKRIYIERMPENERASRLHGQRSQRAGAVYDKPNTIDEEGLYKAGVINKEGKLTAKMMVEVGCDWGGGHSLFALIITATDLHSGITYVIDEWAKKEQVVPAVVPELAKLLDKWGILRKDGMWRFVIDPAGDQGPLGSFRQAFTKEFIKYNISSKIAGYSQVRADKLAKKASIGAINNLTRAGLLYVCDACKRILLEFDRYQLKDGEPPSRGPWRDCLDAMRYCITTPGGVRDNLKNTEWKQLNELEAAEWYDDEGNRVEFYDDDRFEDEWDGNPVIL